MASKVAARVVDRTPNWSSFALTKMLGSAARVPLPKPLSRALVSGYAKIFDVDLSDVDGASLEAGYGNFDAFFTRTLRSGARPINDEPKVMVSPSDGYLRESVRIEKGAQIVAKGHAFSIEELIADEAWARDFIGGSQTTIYLHPRDYHRVHSPVAGRVSETTLVPGRLLPVTDAAIQVNPALFAENERLIHRLQTERGSIAVVMVAAFGVSHMSCSYSEMPAHPKEITRRRLETPRELQKGAELGIFHLGSTVIVLAEKGYDLFPGRGPGPIKMGEPLLRWLE